MLPTEHATFSGQTKRRNEMTIISRMKIVTPMFLLILLGCNSKAQNDKEKIDAIFVLALKADSLNDYKTSITYYSKMLEIDSLNVGALVNRGKALIATTKVQAGFADLNKAIKHYPHERTYYARAVAYMYTNKLDSAETDLYTVTKLKPSFTDAYYALSNLHLMKKEYLPALNNCAFGDKYGINKNLSDALKAEMIKTLGKDIVNNYNSDTLFQLILSIPKIKKVEHESLETRKHGLNLVASLDKTTDWVYTVKVSDGETNEIQFVFKVDAATLKVMNPDGKN